MNADCFVKLCTPDCIDRLDSLKYHSLFKKNQNILNQGFRIFGIFFIRKGKVKVFTTGLNGKEQIVRFASDGHILGHRGVGYEVYPVSATAMEDSYICFIENEVLNELFMANPKFAVELMMYYSRELRKLENRVKNIVQMNIREKTAESLLLIQSNFGINEQGELNVCFSRVDFASFAGSTRQQVAIQLTEFEKEGLIEKRGKKIAILNMNALVRIISEFNMQIPGQSVPAH